MIPISDSDKVWIWEELQGLEPRVREWILNEMYDRAMIQLGVIIDSESPIEQLLSLELFNQLLRKRNLEGMQFGFKTQKEIETEGKIYRVDIFVTINTLNKELKIAVECDGHEFHEKSKEQAARDKARDRALQAKGITVLRFTGSEIWKDAAKCAEEVLEVIKSLTNLEK